MRTLLAGVFGEDVLGAYLYGSAVSGGLRPGSDLDVLAVARRPTTTAQRRRLVERLLEISGRETPDGRWRSVELTVVAHAEVRPWRYPPRFDFQYGDWLRDAFARGELDPWATHDDPDLATRLTLVRRGGVALLGPPPAGLLDEVPADDLRRALRDVRGLAADLDWDARNVLLTLARAWCTLATGEIRSKDGAAVWAAEHVPAADRPVLARAHAMYLHGAYDDWDGLEPRIPGVAGRMLDEIGRLGESRGRPSV